ncbi:hypothetical protein ABT160_43115 [Streptomyces sp. NPDC001941]|uniref:hypothetical protein n=1 Tax=Streptomyces sp. NPDC001941 TaxID=3154659 RepID=UPI00331B6E09
MNDRHLTPLPTQPCEECAGLEARGRDLLNQARGAGVSLLAFHHVSEHGVRDPNARPCPCSGCAAGGEGCARADEPHLAYAEQLLGIISDNEPHGLFLKGPFYPLRFDDMPPGPQAWPPPGASRLGLCNHRTSPLTPKVRADGRSTSQAVLDALTEARYAARVNGLPMPAPDADAAIRDARGDAVEESAGRDAASGRGRHLRLVE